MSNKMKKLKFSLNYLLKLFIKYIDHINISKNFIKLNLKFVSDLYIVSKILLTHTYFRYTIITDICCVDYISKLNRFELNYNFLSIDYNSRIIISINCNLLSLVPSLMQLYKGINWLEREIWDMYGIFFLNHRDLRRILTDYGFEGYPLRKDFPLNGYFEIRYDENRQYLLYEPLELMQNMRYYFFK